MKDLNYYKLNAEEDYIKVPISVLRYITELENELYKQLLIQGVVGRSEQLCEHPRSERSYIGQNKLRCNKCGKEFS